VLFYYEDRYNGHQKVYADEYASESEKRLRTARQWTHTCCCSCVRLARRGARC